MTATAERPPAGTDRVSENSCFLLNALFCTHTQTHKSWHGMAEKSYSCMYVYVCQKMSKDCLCLFPKQIQMYVVVGLQFQCHGLYCLSLCGGYASGAEAYMNDKRAKHQMHTHKYRHVHTQACHISSHVKAKKQPNISPWPTNKSRYCINQFDLPTTKEQSIRMRADASY